MPFDILLISIARALIEVAAMLMLGQGVLWIFGPRARDGNFVYDLFKTGTRPLIKLTRFITPRFVHDAHVGFVAFFILACLWLGLAIVRHNLCVARGLQCS
jgi:hypothetical protein